MEDLLETVSSSWCGPSIAGEQQICRTMEELLETVSSSWCGKDHRPAESRGVTVGDMTS
jgi:hypothetical protein